MNVWDTLAGRPRFLPFPMPACEDAEEYLSYDLVKGVETNGSHCPSAKIKNVQGSTLKRSAIKSVTGNEGGTKKNLFTQKNVRHKINCVECGKVRLVFAFPFAGADWSKLKAELDCMKEEPGYEYVCGNTLFGCDIGDDFKHPPSLDVFSVRTGLECGTEIESYYYSLGQPAICCHCGVDNGLLTLELLTETIDSNSETKGEKAGQCAPHVISKVFLQHVGEKEI